MAQPRKQKKELIGELISEFQIAGNQDSAFDNLAAEQLGVNRTDLHCLNAIENAGGIYLPDRLHQVRIAVKKLRYVLEIAREMSRSRASHATLPTSASMIMGTRCSTKRRTASAGAATSASRTSANGLSARVM